ncbi:MAG: hypothetical protein KIT54_05500 [Phycisphaeraceae bacterium]|nr:hypothetical protein [Phycisphaeraceae bacterium]
MTAQEPIPLYTSKATAPKLVQKPRIFVEYDNTPIAEAIEATGYAVARGSLGYAANVISSGKWVPLEVEPNVPNVNEQEILFLSTKSSSRPVASLLSVAENGAMVVWQSCGKGVLDTRPLAAQRYRREFNGVLQHGGIFVIEIAPRQTTTYLRAKVSHRNPDGGTYLEHSNWEMLSALDNLHVENETGLEIEFDSGEIGQALALAAEGARYECVLGELPDHWTPLARNKHGKIVSAAFRPPEGEGLVLLIPTLPALPSIIPRLFAEVFPTVCPSLFPEHKAQAWVHDERYESTKVLTLRGERRKLDAEYETQAASSDAAIEAEQSRYEHYYTLLRGTGDELVAAVIRVLEEMGFQQVIDVDGETGPTTNKVEDIQILDRDRKLVVDVKGVAGRPADGECQQANKHALMRMREWGITEVQSLTIINSQRLIPPHQRDETAFRDPIIKNARDTQSGLMTTWDLFRIARAVQEFGWPKPAAQDILYQIGRIDRVPSHYKPVGTIADIWKPAFAVELSNTIKQGDRFGVLTPEGYFESVADSIKLNDKPVEEGRAGQKVGIALSEAASRLRKGWTIYRVEVATST